MHKALLSLNPLISFSSDLVWPLGKVTIQVTAGGIMLQM